MPHQSIVWAMDPISEADITAIVDRRIADAMAGMRKLLELHRSLHGEQKDKLHVAIKDIALFLEPISPLTKHEESWMDLERKIAVIDKAKNGWK